MCQKDLLKSDFGKFPLGATPCLLLTPRDPPPVASDLHRPRDTDPPPRDTDLPPRDTDLPPPRERRVRSRVLRTLPVSDNVT